MRNVFIPTYQKTLKFSGKRMFSSCISVSCHLAILSLNWELFCPLSAIVYIYIFVVLLGKREMFEELGLKWGKNIYSICIALCRVGDLSSQRLTIT